MAWIWVIQFLSPFCHQTELCGPSFKETPLSGLPFSCLFLWVGIRLALHPLPPGVEGFLRHNPRLEFWKVASDHRTTQCESGQSNAFCLPQHTCFFVVSFPFFKKKNISTFPKPNPNHILVSVWACFCVDVCVQYFYLSLLSTSQAFRVRKQAKLQLLSVSRESGFCWAGFTRSKRRSSAGLDTNGVNMDESRAKPNALGKICSSWQQVDFEYPLELLCV